MIHRERQGALTTRPPRPWRKSLGRFSIVLVVTTAACQSGREAIPISIYGAEQVGEQVNVEVAACKADASQLQAELEHIDDELVVLITGPDPGGADCEAAQLTLPTSGKGEIRQLVDRTSGETFPLR